MTHRSRSPIIGEHSAKRLSAVEKEKSKTQKITPEETVAQKAKKKLKTLQNKKSNQRLARIEKIYQEICEIESKSRL